MKVDLKDVIEAIELQGDLVNHYYHKNSGIIIYVEDPSVANYKASDIEQLDEYEEWEKDLISSLYDFEENPYDYIILPNKEHINEDKMIMDFCNSIEDISLRDNILNEINEENSFFKIKKAIENNGLLSEWYDYRENAERELAINWCKNNNISYSL
ncbi:MAG: UPF0158 family protein [Clostridium perfringens]|nr:UPF0158 family protein [Clostridium perfringens]